MEAVPFCIIPRDPDAVAELSFLGGERTLFTPVREGTMEPKRPDSG
jgi:hypothetical protein